MNIAIVEDEKYWSEKTKKTLLNILSEQDTDITIFDNGTAFLESNKIFDIIIMDIEMPDMDGFETIQKARQKNTPGIFIISTTHTELGRKGYLVNAFRYIDKVNMDTELKEAIVSSAALFKGNKKITLNIVKEGPQQIAMKNIIFIETSKPCTLIHTKSGELICSNTMKEIKDMLDESIFFQIHKSFIVNLDEIDRLDGRIIYMNNGMDANISKDKYAEFKKMYLNRIYETANA